MSLLSRLLQSAASVLDFSAGDIGIEAIAPQAAIRAFNKRKIGGIFSFDWRDVWQKQHATGFVVAKAMREEILHILHDGIDEALREGTSLQAFKAKVRPLLEDAGWWGKTMLRDPKDGTLKNVQLGSPRRLDMIYRQNLMSSYAAGKWEGIDKNKEAFPFLEYVDVGDERVRHEHRMLSGIIKPVDDPFWNQYAPPNGFGCRCDVRQISRRKMERRGLKVSSEADMALRGANKTKLWKNNRTGLLSRVPAGINPAFAYNVGRERLKAVAPYLDIDDPMAIKLPSGPNVQGPGRVGFAPGVGPLKTPRFKTPPESVVMDEDVTPTKALAEFMRQFPDLIFFDKTQVPLLIDSQAFEQRNYKTGKVRSKISKRGRKRFLPLLGHTLRDPDEIWHLEIDKAGKIERHRFYAGFYKVDDRDLISLVVYSDRGRSWSGTTAFIPGEDGSARNRLRYFLNEVRDGVLVYQKPDEAD